MKIDRHIERGLREWKDSGSRKPLILRGARQTGKTFAVKEFSAGFSRFIHLNLERPRDREPFQHYNSGQELWEKIQLYQGARGDEKSTLLFIDEIQASPEAIRSLRYLYEDLKYLHVIAAGSLLEVFTQKEGFSFPVGRVQSYHMFPVNFAEYLEIRNPPLAQKLRNLAPDQSSDLHQLLLEEFRKYAFVGGMPEVTATFLEKESYTSLRDIYDSLLTGYIEDIGKYASIAMSRYLSHTIDRAPLYAGQRITYEGFGESGFRSREIKNAFETLEKALVLYQALPTGSVKLPLVEQLRRSPKLFFLDVGLVNYRLDFREMFSDRNTLDSRYHGNISEQVVAQELLSYDCHSPKLRFWSRIRGEAEVDFLVPFRDLLIPIEVKSGAIGKLKSLHVFMEQCPHQYAIRVYGGENRVDPITLPSGKSFWLHSLPYYMLSRLNDVLEHLASR